MRLLLALSLLVVPTALRAAPAEKSVPQPAPRREYKVDFEAQRVAVDPDHEVLELEGNVRVVVGRYRLTSEKLQLTRGPYGVELEGGGRIAFCPCPAPPISLGFSSVLLAPPTDALIAQPTVRIGGVPVLWLPYLWLRSRDQIGLVFPNVEWRGQDGLLVGSALHVPLARGEPGVASSTLEISAAGYTALGARVGARMFTPNSTSRVIWDHVDDSALFLDLRGAAADRQGATVAYRVDAVRGPRARTAPSSLDVAARRYDRAQLGVISSGASSLGLSVRSDAPRGDPIDDFGAAGPFAQIGRGGALGSIGAWDAGLGATTRSISGGAESQARQFGVVEFDGRPGPLQSKLVLHERAEFVGRALTSDAWLDAGADLEVGLPLVRRFGAVAHYVKPLVRGGARTVRFVEEPALGQDFALAAAGIDTQLGNWGRRWGSTLELEAGFAGPPSELESIVASRFIFDATQFALASVHFALSAEAAWAPEEGNAGVAIGRIRLGKSDGFFVGGAVEGATSQVPIGARKFTAGGWFAPDAAWLDREGWTTAGEAGVAWWDSVSASGRVDFDATDERLLGVGGLLRYRHACACLSANTWATHRLGRGGFDAGVALDLMP